MKRVLLLAAFILICSNVFGQWRIEHSDGDQMRNMPAMDYLAIGDEHSGIAIMDNDIVITISRSGIFNSRDGDGVVFGKVGLYDKDPECGGNMLELHRFFCHRNEACTTIFKFTEHSEGGVFATYPNNRKIKKFRDLVYNHLKNGGCVRFLIPRYADTDFEIVLPPIDVKW